MKRSALMRMIILSCMLLILSQSVSAKENALSLQSGWEHTASSAYGESYVIGGRYEHKFYNDLWLGGDYTYHGGMSHNNGQDVSYGDVSGHSVLLDILYYPSVLWKLKPYTLAGIGWSWWDFNNKTDVDVKLGNSLAYKLGIGAEYAINFNWSTQLEWSFFKTDIPKHATNSDGSESILLGDDHGKIGEEETMLTVGLKYSF